MRQSLFFSVLSFIAQDVTRNVERLDHLDDPKERKIYEAEVERVRKITMQSTSFL